MKKISLLLICILFSALTFAQNTDATFLIDKAKLFSEHELKQINAKLIKFNEKTKGNILIYVDKNSKNKSIDNLANELLRENLENKKNSMVIVVFTESNDVKIQLSENLKSQFDNQKIILAEEELKRDYFSKGEYYKGLKNLVNGFTGYENSTKNTSETNTENTSEETKTLSEKPINYVTDDVEVLTQQEFANLNTKLKQLEDETSHQVFIYISSSLNGNNLEETTQYLFDKWKVGQKGKDNGVLIAIFLKDRKFRIQTGYGVEGVLPDLVCESIQEEFIIPNFKIEDYYAGLNEATTAIISILKGDTSLKFIHPRKFKTNTNVLIWASILLTILGIIIYSYFGQLKKKEYPISFLVYQLVIFISLACFVQFILTKETNYKLLTENICLTAVAAFLSYLAVIIIDDEVTNTIAKKINYSIIALFVTAASLSYSIYSYSYGNGLSNGIDLENDWQKISFYFTFGCGGLLILYLLFLVKSSGSSSGYSYSSGGYNSSSSGSSSSSSSFSGGGGGRSGGGGSSGSW